MRPTKDCGSKKKKMWIPFHGCLDVLQMCKRWKEQAIQITVYFHMTPSVIDDMPKHWKHSKTWARCHGGRLNPTVVQMHDTECDLFFFACKPGTQIQSCCCFGGHIGPPEHLHYFQVTHRDYRKQWDSFSISGIQRSLWEDEPMCFWQIYRHQTVLYHLPVWLSCSAVSTLSALPSAAYISGS